MAGTRAEGDRLPASVRRARLLDRVNESGFGVVSGLAHDLAVTEMTIRRDLAQLEREGRLTRTHGGAVVPQRRDGEVFDPREPAFDSRRRHHRAEKEAIAARAAALVGEGEVIALDVGTTTLALAARLSERADLRIFTNNLPVAMRLANARPLVYVIGGQLRGPEFAVVGQTAAQQINGLYFDRAFIGVSGVTANGFFDYMIEDSEMKRAYIERAREVVMLCDGSKFAHRALAHVGPLGCCHTIVTDCAPPPDLRAALDDAGVRLVLAEAVPGDGTAEPPEAPAP